MSTDDIVIRRATPSDYEAVLDINRNVYNGLDYMPTMYYEFLQSNKNVVYVAESVKDHKLVGLLNFLFDEECKTVFPLSGRVRPEFQGRRITGLLWAQMFTDHPWIDNSVFDGILSVIGQKAFDRPVTNRLYRWNYVRYRIGTSNLKSWSSFKSANSPTLTPVQLTHSAVDGLISTGRLETFLRQFSIDYIPGVVPTWAAIQLSQRSLRYHLMSSSSLTFVTYDETANLRSISFEHGYALFTDIASGHLAADVFFYGHHAVDFFAHVNSHLRHLANIAGTGDVFMKLNFPLCVEMSAVVKEFESGSWPAGMDGAAAVKTQAYLGSTVLQSSL